jgi:hypothetical protein
MEKETMVKLMLPRAREGEQTEVFVGLNGKMWRISKGVEVEVPAPVAEILKNAELADDAYDAFLSTARNRRPE